MIVMIDWFLLSILIAVAIIIFFASNKNTMPDTMVVYYDTTGKMRLVSMKTGEEVKHVSSENIQWKSKLPANGLFKIKESDSND